MKYGDEVFEHVRHFSKVHFYEILWLRWWNSQRWWLVLGVSLVNDRFEGKMKEEKIRTNFELSCIFAIILFANAFCGGTYRIAEFVEFIICKTEQKYKYKGCALCLSLFFIWYSTKLEFEYPVNSLVFDHVILILFSVDRRKDSIRTKKEKKRKVTTKKKIAQLQNAPASLHSRRRYYGEHAVHFWSIRQFFSFIFPS